MKRFLRAWLKGVGYLPLGCLFIGACVFLALWPELIFGDAAAIWVIVGEIVIIITLVTAAIILETENGNKK